jgi:hypothetical protein
MVSYKVFVIFGFLLVSITLVIQSAPIVKAKENVQSSSINNKPVVDRTFFKFIDSEETSTTAPTTTTSSQNTLVTPDKKKRYLEDDLLNEYFDSNSDEEEDIQLNNKHVLHTKIRETSEKIHDNEDKPVDTDDSKVFSDIKMTPNELTNVIRRRRYVQLNDQLNQRRKRALSTYDFYDTDSLYDPYADLIEQQQQQYDRPTRAFAPLYWYPSGYERSIRSVLAPSFYESSEWPRLYSNTIDDEIDGNPIYDDDEDEADYELNRYPILLQSSNNAFDNLELQQQYNIDDAPIDENRFDDEDLQEFNNDDNEQYHSLYPTENLPHSWIF